MGNGWEFGFSPGTPSSPFPRALFQKSFAPFDKEVSEDRVRWKRQLQGRQQKESRREPRPPSARALPPATAVRTWWTPWDFTCEPGLVTYPLHFRICAWKIGGYDTRPSYVTKMSCVHVSPYYGPFHYPTIWSLSETELLSFCLPRKQATPLWARPTLRPFSSALNLLWWHQGTRWGTC